MRERQQLLLRRHYIILIPIQLKKKKRIDYTTSPFIKAIELSLSEYTQKSHVQKLRKDAEIYRRDERSSNTFEPEKRVIKESSSVTFKFNKESYDLDTIAQRRKDRIIEREQREQREKEEREKEKKQYSSRFTEEISPTNYTARNDYMFPDLMKRKEERARIQAEREERERKLKEEEIDRENERQRKREERNERRTRASSLSPENNIIGYETKSSRTRFKDSSDIERPIRQPRNSRVSLNYDRKIKFDSL